MEGEAPIERFVIDDAHRKEDRTPSDLLHVIDGTKRLKAAKRLGLPALPFTLV